MPFHRISAPGTKPAPFTVIGNPVPPGIWLNGMGGELRNGTGLLGGGELCGLNVSKLLCEIPFRETLSVAVVRAATELVVAVKVVLLLPEGTVIVGGT